MKSRNLTCFKVCLAITILMTITTVLIICKTPAKETVPITIKGHDFQVEIARTQAERAEGLMDRKHLPQRGGMLFVFPYDQRLSFWMKNTYIPLSIAYIDKEGVIKEIHPMEPLSTRNVDSAYSVRYALEVNRGVFKELGIKPGDTVEMPDSVINKSGQ